MPMETTVADTILEQLGGRRFLAMTGARDLVRGRTALECRLPARLAKNGITRVRIVLTPLDVYVVETWREYRGRRTMVDSCDDVYAENLQDVFTRMTGLATRL
jgi:hypothetical protein